MIGYRIPGRETYCILSIGETFVFLRFSTFSSLARFPMLYVGTEERILLYEIFLHYMKKPYAVSTPCAPQGAHRPAILTLWHGPENFIEIFADLRILNPNRP